MAKKYVYKRKPYAVMEKEVIDFLAEQGERIIKDAYNRRNWENQSYNLHDSYGSAVFRDGILQPSTIRYVGPKQANARRNNKELGDFKGQRSKAQKHKQTHSEFWSTTGDNRILTGDTIQAYGRDEVKTFFEGYQLANKGEIELVVVAAMYYAGILESGYLGRKYQVISSATTELNNIAKLLGEGTEVYSLDVNRNKDEFYTNSAFNVTRGQKLN